jgi:elongation factor G
MVFLAGYPIDNMKVTLKDGSFHAVDSDALSFEFVLKWLTEIASKV